MEQKIQNNKNILLILLLVCILLMIFLGIMFKLLMDNSKCVSNPFSYGAKLIEDQGITPYCSCQLAREGRVYNPIYFDGNGIYQDRSFIENGN